MLRMHTHLMAEALCSLHGWHAASFFSHCALCLFHTAQVKQTIGLQQLELIHVKKCAKEITGERLFIISQNSFFMLND